MDKEELRMRTKVFALRIIALVRALSRDLAGRTLAGQIVRSGTSVGANYRACLRARSRAEWLSKINICLEEVDETSYWLELIIESGLLRKPLIDPLLQEANELTCIFAAAIKTARSNSTPTPTSERRSKS